MKTLTTILLTVGALLLLTVASIWVSARLGVVNVAATEDYVPGAEWFFSTLSENSIREQAGKAVREGRIRIPDDIPQSMLANGRHHYVEMCVVCHGAPGVERGEIGAGLKPKPPEMSDVADEMAIEEIYWVVENGIRHTGMPAYGKTHSQQDLWAIAAFVEELGSMSPEEYARQTSSGPGAGSDGGNEQPSDQPEPAAEGHDHAGHSH